MCPCSCCSAGLLCLRKKPDEEVSTPVERIDIQSTRALTPPRCDKKFEELYEKKMRSLMDEVRSSGQRSKNFISYEISKLDTILSEQLGHLNKKTP
jgi:hypothetical protein